MRGKNIEKSRENLYRRLQHVEIIRITVDLTKLPWSKAYTFSLVNKEDYIAWHTTAINLKIVGKLPF